MKYLLKALFIIASIFVMLKVGTGEMQKLNDAENNFGSPNDLQKTENILSRMQNQNINFNLQNSAYISNDLTEKTPNTLKTIKSGNNPSVNPYMFTREERLEFFNKFLKNDSMESTTIQNIDDNEVLINLEPRNIVKTKKRNKIDKIAIHRKNNPFILIGEKLFTPKMIISKHNPNVKQVFNVYRYRKKSKNFGETEQIKVIDEINYKINYKKINKWIIRKNIKIYKKTDIYIGKERILLVYRSGKIRMFSYNILKANDKFSENKKKYIQECLAKIKTFPNKELEKYCNSKVNIMLVLAYFPLLIDADAAFNQLHDLPKENFTHKNVRELIDETFNKI